MKTRTKWIIIGSVIGLLVIGLYGASQDKKRAVSALEEGKEALEAHEWEVALDAFSKSLEASGIYSSLSHEQVRAHLGRGTALAMLGQETAAVQAFSVAYSLDPQAAPSTGHAEVVAASEKAKAELKSRNKEAADLVDSGAVDLASSSSDLLPTSTVQEELLGILNGSASLLGDKWSFEGMQLDARDGQLWLDLSLQRSTTAIQSDQVRNQAALVIAVQAGALAEVFGVTHVRLECEGSTGRWSVKNMEYAGSLLENEETFGKGTVLLLTSME